MFFNAIHILADIRPLKYLPADFDKIPEAVKSQLAMVARDEQGKVVDATGVQIPGVLDALYNYTGPLGITFDGDIPTMRLWAPTARSVTLHFMLRFHDTSRRDFPAGLG